MAQSSSNYDYELLSEDVTHPDYLFKVIIIGDTGENPSITCFKRSERARL